MVKSQDPRRSLRRHEQFFASAHMNGPARDTRWRSWLRRSCLATAIAVGMLHNLGAAAEPPQASDPAAPVETPATESQPSSDAGPVEVDPSITLKGAVWRTKSGIVFLKTPVGLLTLSSKTTLKDLKSLARSLVLGARTPSRRRDPPPKRRVARPPLSRRTNDARAGFVENTALLVRRGRTDGTLRNAGSEARHAP